jgi:hypothetical protein
MKRLLALPLLALMLGACSVSVNDDGPQVVVIATATVPAIDTPDASNYYFEFSGIVKMSGSALQFPADGTCNLPGITITDGNSPPFPMMATTGGYMSGYLRFHSSEAHDGQCWYAFDAFAGYPLDVTVAIGGPGASDLIIPYTYFKDGGPVTLVWVTP